jgi:hypothetical protein
MSNVYEILEQCLVEIEQGADVDTVLFRHPEYAEELRPILEASTKAKELSVPEPSSDVVRRNRAKVLQRAAEMREAKVKPASRFWSASLRRLAVAVVVLLMMFVSGTGLVRAASNTIPGDNLYPVKRTWEDILLLFTFDPQERELLEFEHENERLEELLELFTEGRSVKVDFAGYVTRQSATEWRVSGITVVLSPQTELPIQPVNAGDAVRIVGRTQSEKTVLAERIELLPDGSKLPDVEDNESQHEEENHEDQQENENSNSGSNSGSGSGNENEVPQGEVTETSRVEGEHQKETFEGVLESADEKNRIWTVNGRPMDVSTAEITGTLTIGATVKVEGYFDSNGTFIATKLEFIRSDSSSGNSQDDNNDNDDNDIGDDNENGDDKGNDNGNDGDDD